MAKIMAYGHEFSVTNTGKQLYSQYAMDVMLLHPVVKGHKPTSSVM